MEADRIFCQTSRPQYFDAKGLLGALLSTRVISSKQDDDHGICAPLKTCGDTQPSNVKPGRVFKTGPTPVLGAISVTPL